MPQLFGDSLIDSALKRGAGGAPIVLESLESSGRRSAALRLAAGLLCTGKPGRSKPCLVCGACTRVLAGTHPDLHILDYDGKNVKIEQVRELRSKAFIKPHEGDTKVFVLHDADQLSEQCQNALLKILEEPQTSAFVLTATDSTSLLRTVRSRCVAYRIDSAGGDFAGGSPPCLALADRLIDSLGKSELEIFQAASELETLKREQYPEFLNALCGRLARLARNGDSRAHAVYEYLCSQREMLPHNPSTAALACGLAAFCGPLYARERGQVL